MKLNATKQQTNNYYQYFVIILFPNFFNIKWSELLINESVLRYWVIVGPLTILMWFLIF